MYCLFWICSGNYSSTVGFINNTIEREFYGGNKMKLGDVYVNKKDKSIIQIDSYATHMGNFPEKSIVVFRQMERHNAYEIGSVPSFNGYGSREEIESEYELLVPQEKLNNYYDWNEIFDMVEKSR